MRALNANIEQNFVWGIEQGGAQRHFRLIQKRGKVVDAEDFLPVRGTYPKHPLTEQKPAAVSKKQLKDQRKADIVQQL